MKSEVEVGARAFASDRNHGACHWLSGSSGELHFWSQDNSHHSTTIFILAIVIRRAQGRILDRFS